jgi:predicted metal-binding membrane protein
MMTPSAAPLVLLFTALKKRGADGEYAALYSLYLLFGYLSAWAGFSVMATGLQMGLETVGLSDGPMMTIRSQGFAGLIMVIAGLYQFSNLKNACLSHCQSPGQFLADHRRPGPAGALRLGVDHGIYCLGCCWALMALLFVGGIMNLYWIVGLTLYVLAEKYASNGLLLSRFTGGVLMLVGGYFILDGFVWAYR